MWEAKNVTVFVTGGIAAFKAATLEFRDSLIA